MIIQFKGIREKKDLTNGKIFFREIKPNKND